jgi:hypothetical protein
LGIWFRRIDLLGNRSRKRTDGEAAGSNHRAGRRANENTADIVVGDDAKEIQRQLDLVAVAATEEA